MEEWQCAVFCGRGREDLRANYIDLQLFPRGFWFAVSYWGQFYNNPHWDATPDLKVQWYQNVATITGAQKLMVGALVADTGHDEGCIPLDQMVNNVIAPLQATFGSQFGCAEAFAY